MRSCWVYVYVCVGFVGAAGGRLSQSREAWMAVDGLMLAKTGVREGELRTFTHVCGVDVGLLRNVKLVGWDEEST